jgi:hypothetical protein
LRLLGGNETTSGRKNEKKSKKRGTFLNVQGGTRNLISDHQDAQSGVIGPEISRASLEPTRTGCNLVESDCSSVVNAPRAEQQNEVAEQLAAAPRAEWLRNPDERNLRAALLDLLRQLERRSS